jgi:glyoxylase-like metal-dependent hydrolase (beta-lactamase superfamily II)
VRARKIVGVFPGEHVLLWEAPSGERVLFAGDTFRAHVGPDHPDLERWGGPPALYLGSSYQYVGWILDPERLRASLRRVLDEASDLDLLCSGHSLPYRDHPGAALAQLVAFDWRPVLRAGGRPVVYTRLLENTAFGRRQAFPLVARQP